MGIKGQGFLYLVADIDLMAEEFILRSIITKEILVRNIAWGAHEFVFYDLN